LVCHQRLSVRGGIALWQGSQKETLASILIRSLIIFFSLLKWGTSDAERGPISVIPEPFLQAMQFVQNPAQFLSNYVRRKPGLSSICYNCNQTGHFTRVSKQTSILEPKVIIIIIKVPF
jgi:hypothetical protein